MIKSSSKLEIVLGVLTALTGLLYLLQFFGQTESEVVTWGLIAVVLGGIVVFQGLIKDKVNNVIEGVLIFFVLLIQIPAILLWFIFSGSSISDGTPTSNFVAHWIFAAPHIVIALFALTLIVSLLRRRIV
ncbi:hypothetical protein U5N28_19680 [Lysinibacillus telephonicus]|uniref:Uncharacterized protein n=1 Tax=Lysinibacillus telephonicus TaxID=1714840 RepID=A0A3S0JKD0_9BACI|nr:hypothetical protein [Lysinibacillus telephonicus]RTQ87730.1 hypothetical protein EKG35_18680 [Lysinibacillus telephonicus]